MKTSKKIAALVMSVVVTAGLISGCGSAAKNNFTAADLVDTGTAQQRWLRHPESDIIVNPAAIDNPEYTDDNADMGLTLALSDSEGNATQTIEDAIFILESLEANGMGAEPVYEMNFDPDSGLKGLGKLTSNSSSAEALVASTGEAEAKIFDSTQTIMVDYTVDYYILLKVAAVSGANIGMTVYMQNPTSELTPVTVSTPGTYLFNVTEYMKEQAGYDPAVPRKLSIRLILQPNGQYNILDYQLCTMKKGYQPSTEKMKNEFGLYYSKSNQIYPYGTGIETSDIIMGSSVSRTITCKSAGAIAVCGAIYGNAEYNEKDNTINVDCSSYKYQISLKRKNPVVYYDSYENLVADENGTSEPSSTSKYWAMKINTVAEGDSFSMAASASATKTFDELNDSSDDAISGTMIKKYYALQPDFWDTYIASNDVSAYVQNIPE